MATPKGVDLLNPADRAFYDKLSVRSPQVADKFLRSVLKDSQLPDALNAASVAPAVPVEAPVYTVDPEEDVALIESGYETERERLERVAKEEPVTDLNITEDIAEPDIEPILAYVKPTIKEAQETPDIILQKKDGQVQEADAITKFKSGLKDDELAAWRSFKDELLGSGASLYEAESRASQLVAGIVQAPREMSTYAAIKDAPPPIDPEAYRSGDAGFFDAIERKPLESTSAFAFRKSREGRGALNMALIDEQVAKDLAAYQLDPSNKFYVEMKDRNAGGIDKAKVEQWKLDRKQQLILRGEQDVRTRTLSLILDGAAQAGNELKPGTKEYADAQAQANAIGELWLEETAPDVYKERNTPRTLTTGAVELLEKATRTKDESGKLYETRVGAGARSVGGLIRYVIDPVTKAMTYDVDENNKPVDPEDYNYKLAQVYKQSFTDIASGDATYTDYVKARSVFTAGIAAASPRKVGSGSHKDELSSGNYLNDVAYAIAIGRTLGDDFMDMPNMTNAFGEGSTIPFWIGLTGEIALPISPIAAVGSGLKMTGAATKVVGLTRVAEGLDAVGAGLINPISKGISPLVTRSLEVGRATEIMKALELGDKAPRFFSFKPVAETVAPVIATRISEMVAKGDDLSKLPGSLKVMAQEGKVASDLVEGLLKYSEDAVGIQTVAKPLTGTKLGGDITNAIVAEAMRLKTALTFADDAIGKRASKLLTDATDLAAKEIASGKLSYKTLHGLVRDVDRVAQLVDEPSLLSGMKNNVVAAVVSKSVAEDLARAGFNDWVFITPTAIVRAAAWEKYGSKVDDTVKQILYGTVSKKSIDELVKATMGGPEGARTVPLNPTARPIIIKAINEELGALKAETSPYWKNLIRRVSGGNRLNLEQFNDVVNVLRQNAARKTIGNVVSPKATSILTERAAIPLGRRLPIVRLAEDLVRPITTSKLGESISLYAKKTLGIKPVAGRGVPLEIANALKAVHAQINSLPAELAKTFRKEILDAGKKPDVAFADVIHREIIEGMGGIKVPTIPVADVAELYYDLAKRFFGLSQETKLVEETIDGVKTVVGRDPEWKLREMLMKADGPIYTALKGFVDADGNIAKTSLEGLVNGRSVVIDIFDEIAIKARSANPKLVGAKSITSDALADIFIAKVLDAQKDTIVGKFANELKAKNPELVYNTASKARDLENFSMVSEGLDKTATESYKRIKQANIERNAKIAENDFVVSLPDRKYGELSLDADMKVVYDFHGIGDLRMNLVFDTVNKELQTFFKDGKVFDQVAEQVYYKITKAVVEKGFTDTAGLEAEIINIYASHFSGSVESLHKSVREALATKYPEVSFRASMNEDDVVEAGLNLITQSAIADVLQLRSVDVISKLMGMGFDLENKVGGFGAIDAMAGNINGIKLFLDPESLRFFNEMTQNNKFIQAALEDLGKSNEGAQQFLMNRIGWLFGTIRRNTMGGMLGGIWTTNTRFLGVNNLTAPIIASVTNPGYVTAAALAVPNAFARPIARASRMIPRVGSDLAGAAAGAGLGFATTGTVTGTLLGAGLGVVGIETARKLAPVFEGASRLRGKVGDINDFIVTQDGKIYTSQMMADVFKKNVYTVSQYDFDFGTALLADVKRAAEVTSDGRVAGMAETLRRSYGPLTRNTSFWNMVGSEADYVFREAVFTEAIKRGVPEAEAATLARNTLLDYSAISEFERKYISSWVMFYSFTRQATVESVMGLMRPGSSASIVKQIMVQQRIENEFLKKRDAYTGRYAGNSRMWAIASENQYEGYRTGYYGPQNPMVTPLMNMFQFLWGASDSYTKGNMIAAATAGAFDNLTEQPWISFAKDMSTLMNPYQEAPLGYLPASMMAQLGTMGAMPWAIEEFHLAPQKNKDGSPKMSKPGDPTFNGYQYKFKDKEGKIKFLEYSLLAVMAGFDRSLRDWTLATAMERGVDPEDTELKRYKDGNWVLYLSGMETPIPSPTWLRAQEEVIKQIHFDLAATKKSKDGITRSSSDD